MKSEKSGCLVLAVGMAAMVICAFVLPHLCGYVGIIAAIAAATERIVHAIVGD